MSEHMEVTAMTTDEAEASNHLTSQIFKVSNRVFLRLPTGTLLSAKVKHYWLSSSSLVEGGRVVPESFLQRTLSEPYSKEVVPVVNDALDDQSLWRAGLNLITIKSRITRYQSLKSLTEFEDKSSKSLRGVPVKMTSTEWTETNEPILTVEMDPMYISREMVPSSYEKRWDAIRVHDPGTGIISYFNPGALSILTEFLQGADVEWFFQEPTLCDGFSRSCTCLVAELPDYGLQISIAPLRWRTSPPEPVRPGTPPKDMIAVRAAGEEVLKLHDDQYLKLHPGDGLPSRISSRQFDNLVTLDVVESAFVTPVGPRREVVYDESSIKTPWQRFILAMILTTRGLSLYDPEKTLKAVHNAGTRALLGQEGHSYVVSMDCYWERVYTIMLNPTKILDPQNQIRLPKLSELKGASSDWDFVTAETNGGQSLRVSKRDIRLFLEIVGSSAEWFLLSRDPEDEIGIRFPAGPDIILTTFKRRYKAKK